ncbi:translation initiation factor IF-2 [Streptomyces sp. NPDC051561]|uniref:translation initiation factor IF-2 n=1 Tax=Streptomyces sp. NPDC051561 TaxID=3365658 RepID=UPI0037ABF251
MSAYHDMTERAGALIDLERQEEARPLLTARLAEDPTDANAWLHLARCDLIGEVTSQALKDCEYALGQALALEPGMFGALLMRQRLLSTTGRQAEAQETARLLVHTHPDHWVAHVSLATTLQTQPGKMPEAYEAAVRAVRLGPEETGAHEALWKAAYFSGRKDVAAQAITEALRIDPQCSWAHTMRAHTASVTPGAGLPSVADAYADALAVSPSSEGLRSALESTVYRMLRGTRWLALVCLAIAGVTGRIFPDENDPVGAVHPGTRVYALAMMAAIWVFGAWRRYRGMRAGARMSVRALLSTSFWARVALGQAVWCMVCAVLVVAVPWGDLVVPRTLFWVALVPTLLTVWFERSAVREQRLRGAKKA